MITNLGTFIFLQDVSVQSSYFFSSSLYSEAHRQWGSIGLVGARMTRVALTEESSFLEPTI